jgi:hypothetical protein
MDIYHMHPAPPNHASDVSVHSDDETDVTTPGTHDNTCHFHSGLQLLEFFLLHCLDGCGLGSCLAFRLRVLSIREDSVQTGHLRATRANVLTEATNAWSMLLQRTPHQGGVVG